MLLKPSLALDFQNLVTKQLISDYVFCDNVKIKRKDAMGAGFILLTGVNANPSNTFFLLISGQVFLKMYQFVPNIVMSPFYISAFLLL